MPACAAPCLQVRDIVDTRKSRADGAGMAPTAAVNKRALTEMTERFRHAEQLPTRVKEYVSFDQLYDDEEDPETARKQRAAQRKARW